MDFKTHSGIILRMYDSNAFDRVVQIIKTDGSRLNILAKGVKKEKSRKAYSLDSGNLIQTKNVEGYSVPIMSEVKVKETFLGWKKNHSDMFLFQLILEVTKFLCGEEDPNPEFYTLLFKILNSSSANKLLLTNYFLLNALKLNGHLPTLNINVETGDKLDIKNTYSNLETVGFVDEKSNKKSDKINATILKSMKFFAENLLKKSLKLNLNPDDLFKMLKLQIFWVELTLEKELKSKKIVLSLIKNNGN